MGTAAGRPEESCNQPASGSERGALRILSASNGVSPSPTDSREGTCPPGEREGVNGVGGGAVRAPAPPTWGCSAPAAPAVL